MRLNRRTLADLAEMICEKAGGAGFDWVNFPYRSSSYLTEFFANCDLGYVHDGSTRRGWVLSVLEELNAGVASNPQLPADGIVRVIQELMDPAEFRKAGLDRTAALEDLNRSLGRDGLQAFLDETGRCHIRNLGTHASSAGLQLAKRSWTQAELERRSNLAKYLDEASEDEFISHLLVPIFAQLGFKRISVAGHKDRHLEYGKDLWMKYQLPTRHFLYFGVQPDTGRTCPRRRRRRSRPLYTEIDVAKGCVGPPLRDRRRR